MKILIIEDEVLIKESLAKMLEMRGAQVVTCSSGIEGIQYIKNEKFDRIICDLMLQDVTGFDVIEDTRKSMKEEPKFIIMTAYSSPLVMEKAKRYGYPILNKPFGDINQALNDILK